MRKQLQLLTFLLTAFLLTVGFASCGEDWKPQEDPTPVTPTPDPEPEPTPSGETKDPSFTPLHVQGRWFVDENGVRRNLHGFAQTYSPWFNEQGTKWNNFDVSACLKYNKDLVDQILANGWKMDFVRMHMDPYWSNEIPPGVYYVPESDISYFNFDRFMKYLDEVFIPMAEYFISKGLYVVMRPPGVCPEQISVGGVYHQYLKKVWTYVAQHPKLRNNGYVMFELANEPVQICNSSGSPVNNWDGSKWDERGRLITQFMQEIVDEMRRYCDNILLIPGLHYQMLYSTFEKYPLKGNNIGYAVHCYPGWYNSGQGGNQKLSTDVRNCDYSSFKSGWDNEIMSIGKKAPIVVTEMDWGPKKYSPSHLDSNGNEAFDQRWSFGFAYTGTTGGNEFGANFMSVCDESCNISWLLFTGPDILAKYNDKLPNGNTFLTDPQACPRPVYRQYLYYASSKYNEMINQPDYGK
jgi:hypothetical protein